MNYLFKFSGEDFDIQQKENGLHTEVEKLVNVLKRIENKKRNERENNRNSGPYRTVVDYSGINARRIIKKPAVPFSYYDLTTDGKSQLMEAIISHIKSTLSGGKVFYDTKGNASRFETENRVYYTVNAHTETYGLLVCVDVEDNNWLTDLKRIVGDYINCYAGEFEPSVITVIKSDLNNSVEHQTILENRIKELLKYFNLHNSFYCPVVFWDENANYISNSKHEDSQMSKSVIKVLEAMDRFFETPTIK